MTTLDETIQLQAEESFRKGLKDFSKRKNWSGPITNLKNEKKCMKLFSIKKNHLGYIR